MTKGNTILDADMVIKSHLSPVLVSVAITDVGHEHGGAILLVDVDVVTFLLEIREHLFGC